MSDFLNQVQVPFAHVENNLYEGLKKQKSSKDELALHRAQVAREAAGERVPRRPHGLGGLGRDAAVLTV